MNADLDHTSSNSPGAASHSSAYLVTVAALLVVIIAMLAVLWHRERRGRIAAERDLREAIGQSSKLQGALRGLVASGDLSAARPVQREDLPVQMLMVDGQKRPALQLSASAGRRLGFRSGDLILVSEQPSTSQPATAPDRGEQTP